MKFLMFLWMLCVILVVIFMAAAIQSLIVGVYLFPQGLGMGNFNLIRQAFIIIFTSVCRDKLILSYCGLLNVIYKGLVALF